MRTRIKLLLIGAGFLFLTGCSRDNLIPMSFGSVTPGVNKSSPDTSWTTRTIAGNGLQSCRFQAVPGIYYRLEVQTPVRLDVYTYVRIPGLLDSLYVNSQAFYQSKTGDLFCTAESCIVVLWIQNETYASVTYSLRLRTQPLYPAGTGAYTDSLPGATAGMPVRHEIIEQEFSDTIGFDQPLAKYTYKVPLDSFESVSFSFSEKRESLYTQKANCYIESRRFDTIPGYASRHFYSGSTYWNSVTDTLLFTISEIYSHAGALALSGVATEFLPLEYVTVNKKKFVPVMADAFDRAGVSPIMLKQDTMYSLSLRTFLERDTFCLKAGGDSLYQLIVESPASLALCVWCSNTSIGVLSQCFKEKDTLVFKGGPVGSFVNFVVFSPDSTPVSYTASISPYGGALRADAYEPDDFSGGGSSLAPGNPQDHTIFPAFEKDFFKVVCGDNDTFTIRVDEHASLAQLDSIDFSFNSYYVGTNSYSDLHLLAHTDSGTVSRYTYFKSYADTVCFFSTAWRYCEYSITLSR